MLNVQFISPHSTKYPIQPDLGISYAAFEQNFALSKRGSDFEQEELINQGI
jgi:hypothetical protein